METGTGWKQFKDNETPSTVDLDKSFFENVSKGKKVLDFGCAWGRIGFQLQKMGYNVKGFDINENAIEGGVYFLKLTGENFSQSSKIVVVK